MRCNEIQFAPLPAAYHSQRWRTSPLEADVPDEAVADVEVHDAEVAAERVAAQGKRTMKSLKIKDLWKTPNKHSSRLSLFSE